MSRPPNPLASYRSARYYHVLVMCDRTSTAEALVNLEDENAWTRTDTSSVPDKYGLHKRSLIELDTTGGSSGGVDGDVGKYSILVHGMSDADFTITQLDMTAYTASTATAADRNTSIATEGSLVISEPKGVVFFDTLINTMRSMKADASTCCFVLKTFFVGYTFSHTNGDRIETLTSIPPLMFLLTDAEATYSEEGSMYNLQFVAMTAGAARLPQYARAADGINLLLSKDPQEPTTIATALEQLFKGIAANYNRHYDCVIAVAKNKGIKNPTETYYRVDYEVVVDDVYSQREYAITDAPIQYKIGGEGCFEPPSFKNNMGASIEDAIHRILNMCPRLKKDMVDGVGDGVNAIKYEYKIIPSVRTYLEGNKKRCTITYAVRRFLAPRGGNIQKLLESGASQSAPEAIALRQNLIEFDYVFSGANIDILEFDIKMNYGLAYLQVASTANSFKDQLEVVSSRSTQVNTHSDPTSKYGDAGEISVPVFFSPQIRGLTTINSQEPATTVDSAFSMAKHASIEVAEATVKITGNPYLYGSTATSTHSNVQRSSVAPVPAAGTSGETNTPTLTSADFRYWGAFPALAKINIYMPANNDDVALMMGNVKNPQGVPPDYRKKFWYDGYYYVYGIQNTFTEGEFTQTLMMVAIPNGALIEKEGVKKETEQTVKSITECYDSKEAIRPSDTTPPPVVPHNTDTTAADPAAGAKVTNRRDANSWCAIPGSPSDVRGWDSASPAVQKGILDASAKTGVDAKLLAQFAQIESNFKPSAKATTSSATGLYQHLNGTWMDLVKAGRIDSIPANTDRDTALARRTDPYDSALGGAVYLQLNAQSIGSSVPGDLYLAHFAGPGVAKKVIRAGNSGGGDKLLEDVLGVERITRMRNANPFLQKIHTVEQLRSWSAKKIANTLAKGVSTADLSSPANVPTVGGSRGTPTASAPASSTKPPSRTAAEVAAAANGNKPTADKNKKKECGTKTPQNTDQQGKTNEIQPSVATPTKNPTK